MDTNTEPLLDSAGVEKIICIGRGDGKALEVARCRKAIDIPFIRIGKKRIRYRRSDVEAWLAKHTVTPNTPGTQPKPRFKRRASRRVA